MLTAAVAGDVFTSPAPDAVLAAIKAVAGRAGALLIVKNYTGDRLNFGLAAELARAEGIPVEMVVVADDAALAALVETGGPARAGGHDPRPQDRRRRGRGGGDLAEVAAEARAAAAAVATMGVALSPCTVPAAGKPGFSLEEDEIELGLGIHGEPGVRRAAIEPADALVAECSARSSTGSAAPGARMARSSTTSAPRRRWSWRSSPGRAIDRSKSLGYRVERAYAGTFLSALEMAGVSLSVLLVDDARLAPAGRPDRRPRLAQSRGRDEVASQAG